MLPVELHLAINHVPVLGLPFAAGLLVAGIVLDNAEWRRAGLWSVALAAAAAWIVSYTGGLAADAAGGLPGISDHDVAAHAAAAWTFVWTATAAGGAAVAVLAASDQSPSRRSASAVLALALLSSGAGGWAAHLGGRIRHPELRGGAGRDV